MPAFLTHCIFAEEVLHRLENKIKIQNNRLKPQILKRMPLFYLGAQGPDLFFFYKAQSWIKHKNDYVEKLGLYMHDNNTQKFFTESLNYVICSFDTDSKKILRKKIFFDLLTYYLGYICHFSLDSTTHPFIHYHAGVDTDKNKKTHKYHNYHKLFESIIDVLIFEQKKNLPAHKFKTFELVDTKGIYNNILEDFYIYIIKKVYKKDISRKQIDRAINDIVSILKLSWDPYGIKFIIFFCFENLIGKKDEITTFMRPKRVNKNIDYLNLTKRGWNHPCNNKLQFNFSFIDLYNTALINAKKFILESIKYINNSIDNSNLSKRKIVTKDIKKIFEDISYSTGIKCGRDKDLKYFNSIFENK